MSALVRNNSLVKPNRNDLFYPIEQIFNNFYDNFWNETTTDALKSKTGFPRWDIYQTDKEYVVEISVTGCKPEDVSIEIIPAKGNSNYNRMLKVSGKSSEEKTNVQYMARELRKSSFERHAYIPDYIKDDPEATMKNGILKLTWQLPKEVKAENKKIQIKQLDK